MANEQLHGRKIAFLATNGFEQSELTHPWEALRKAGASVELISLEHGNIRGMNHDEKADAFQVDHTVDEVSPDEYDGLVLPGGVMNPDTLRMNSRAVAFVREFVEQGKPVAAICHGPWTLIEADVVRGRTVTSWPSLQTDLRNAGAEWIDEEVVWDRSLVTSRRPDDLPAFCDKAIDVFAAASPVASRH